MKKVLIGIVIAIAVIALLIGGLAIAANAYASSKSADDIPAHVELEPNELGTVVAVGKGLYDKNGDKFTIKGINFGNLFVAEGWMTVNSLGAAYNNDGSFKSVNYQGIVEEYEEVFQEEMDAVLADRVAKGDFTEEELNTLLDTFF